LTGPQTILIGGGSLALLCFIGFNEVQKASCKIPIKIRDRLPGNYNAMTIPPFGIYILKSEVGNRELIRHELIHWYQYKKMGLLAYYGRYFSEMKCYGYDGMPMEVEARACECEHCKTNYTDCVRKGIARTVFNPMFRIDI
jgi:hypothetical protein